MQGALGTTNQARVLEKDDVSSPISALFQTGVVYRYNTNFGCPPRYTRCAPLPIALTLRTRVSEGVQPGCGVQTTSASSFPRGPMTPFSGDTVNAPRDAHEKAAVALPPLVRVKGRRRVVSRLPAGNCFYGAVGQDGLMVMAVGGLGVSQRRLSEGSKITVWSAARQCTGFRRVR